MMLFCSERKTLTCQLQVIRVLFFHLILTHVCEGQFKLIGSSEPIVATLGDDIILPCNLDPAEDASGMTLEWTRPDLSPRFVCVWRSGQELVGKRHQSFEGRTSLFINELQKGNISLKLSKVKLSDHGTYRCYIPAQEKQTFVQLVIASYAVSAPFLTLAGLDKATSRVVLQCESKGWYPEPEVLWLDAEGNLLSAGPTETVRGPDDLYTVSSRVTVEKSNNITCRVQQNNINQTRETQIHVPDDFFNIQSSSSAMTVGFAVSLAVCIVFILSLFVWKIQNITKSKRRDKRGIRNRSKTKKTEDQVFTEDERDSEQPMINKTAQMKTLNKGEVKMKTKCLKNQKSTELQAQQTWEEAEKRVKTLREKLETKKKQVENKPAELQQLQEEKERRENHLQTLTNKLKNKNKELETIKANPPYWWAWSSTKEAHQKKKKEAETEVELLKKELETTETELETQIKEFDDQQAEVLILLQEVIQMMKTNLQEHQETNDDQLKENQQSAEKKWNETSEELKLTQKQLEMKNEELDQTKRHVDQLMAEVKQLKEEKQRVEDQQEQGKPENKK